jgi:hypothetical protein
MMTVVRDDHCQVPPNRLKPVSNTDFIGRSQLWATAETPMTTDIS